MGKILQKEMKLCASPLSYFFILFGLMFFLPGYPVLCGAFFVTFGIYQSFQNSREANDIAFSLLLPVAKRETVKGKYLFVCMIQLCGILLMTLAVLVRMTLLSDAVPYRNNALMNGNFFALGMAFVIFALFNLIFVGGFFKTAYKIGRPFLIFVIVNFLTIGLAETLHYFFPPLNAFGTEHLGLQLLLLGIGIAVYLSVTLISYRVSCRRFETIDL